MIGKKVFYAIHSIIPTEATIGSDSYAHYLYIGGPFISGDISAIRFGIRMDFKSRVLRGVR
jgi:hypothetical protein